MEDTDRKELVIALRKFVAYFEEKYSYSNMAEARVPDILLYAAAKAYLEHA